MYLTHPVRRMRDDPTEGASVALVVSLEEGAGDGFQQVIEGFGGSVDRELQFGALQVTVPETGIDALCSVAGIDHVQTADALSLGVEEPVERVEHRDGERDEHDA